MTRWALEYRSLGLSVLPLRGKRPMTARGVHDASSDIGAIREWWSRWPDANIGIACLGLVVLDIDPRHGGDEVLAQALTGRPPLPPTWTVRTGGARPGRHIYFGSEADSLVGRLGHSSGVDVKTRGGYVVAPPSRHPETDQRYSWIANPREQALAELPEWLGEELRRPHSELGSTFGHIRFGSIHRLRAWLAKRAPAVSGRNGHTHTLTTALQVLRLADGDVAAAAAAMAEWNRTCQPPWSAKELERKLSEAARILASGGRS
jgi:hypothetical protein